MMWFSHLHREWKGVGTALIAAQLSSAPGEGETASMFDSESGHIRTSLQVGENTLIEKVGEKFFEEIGEVIEEVGGSILKEVKDGIIEEAKSCLLMLLARLFHFKDSKCDVLQQCPFLSKLEMKRVFLSLEMLSLLRINLIVTAACCQQIIKCPQLEVTYLIPQYLTHHKNILILKHHKL